MNSKGNLIVIPFLNAKNICESVLFNRLNKRALSIALKSIQFAHAEKKTFSILDDKERRLNNISMYTSATQTMVRDTLVQ
jgi:hypothetical protein